MGRDGCKLFAPALQNGSLEWKIFYLTDFLASNLIQKYSQISIRIFLAFHLLERSGCKCRDIINVKSCKKFSAKLGVETKLVNSLVNSFLEKVNLKTGYQKLLTILHAF